MAVSPAAVALLLLAAVARPAWAHTGYPLQPHDLWTSWSLEPGVLVALGLSGWLYLRGTRRLWQRAGAGRGLRRWQRRCFIAGMVALVVALVSPLDAMGSVLFSAHMTQHELLMLVAAPLLVVAGPVTAWLWALPLAARRTVGRVTRAPAFRGVWDWVTNAGVAWILQAAAVWVWHAPGLYDRTITSEPVHVLQHASFVGSALLYWESLRRLVRRGGAGHGIAILSLFTTAMYGGVLGALLTFSTRPWYAVYESTTVWWGLTTIEDQQLGGLIMWVPFGFVHLAAALLLFVAWMRAMERDEPAGVIRPRAHPAPSS